MTSRNGAWMVQTMHVISFKILREYAQTHADCQEALNNWDKHTLSIK